MSCDLWNLEMFEQGMKWNSRPPQRLSSQYADKSMKPKTWNESVGWDHQWEGEWSTNYNTNKNLVNIIHKGPKASNYTYLSLHGGILCHADCHADIGFHMQSVNFIRAKYSFCKSLKNMRTYICNAIYNTMSTGKKEGGHCKCDLKVNLFYNWLFNPLQQWRAKVLV